MPPPEMFVATCTSDNTSAYCDRLRGLPPEILDGPVGEYVIGFIVEDLDGNQTQSNAPVTVQ